MTPKGITEEMARIVLVLQEKLDEAPQLTVNVANAQRDYRVAVATEIVRLRLNGESVSLAEIIAKGNPEVADLKVANVIADGERQICLKSLGVNMSIADTLRSLLKASKDEDISAEKNFYD